MELSTSFAPLTVRPGWGPPASMLKVRFARDGFDMRHCLYAWFLIIAESDFSIVLAKK